MTRYGRPLTHLRRTDQSGFGGKSASLGELLHAGIPVPPGFALSTAAYERFLRDADLPVDIDRRLSGVLTGGQEALRSACAEIVAAIGAAPVPAAVRAEIGRGYEALAEATGDPAPPVAVRSSALGEDSEAATFAGQQTTVLWVRTPEAVVDAVRSCWASLYSPTAVSYRARATADQSTPATPAMGVAVQAMVDALVSGVMFTCNPVSGDPSTVAVNASWGLGEAVVAGEVTPDEYRLSKVTGEVLHQHVGSKLIEHVPATEGGGTVKRDVAPERRDRPCLAGAELDALMAVAHRVERHFGSHQDIEWALARDGSPPDSLFVLQSRPVTALPQREPKPPPASALAMVMQTFGADRGPDRS